MIDRNNVKRLLIEIELALKKSELWSNELPDESTLNSSEPFCIDTMTGPQWLQWIFIPRMIQLLDNNLPLPTQFAIAPYFEESLPEENEYLLSLLKELDFIFN